MIKKFTTSHKGKKYNVIIELDDEIIIGKIYPARYKEAIMSNKAPVWFQSFQKEMMEFKSEVISRLNNLEKDVKAIKNCPTIKAELK